MIREHERAAMSDRSRELQRFVSTHSGTQPASARPESWQPTISIVMPSFNQAQFIERSILSVLNQNYPSLELIIIDGGSTDGTVDVIKKYERELAHWISEKDRGQSDALNKGFARATGDLYGWLNSDDLYTPGAFGAMVQVFRDRPSTGVVFGDYYTIDSNDNVVDYNYAFDFSLRHFVYEGFHANAQAMLWRAGLHQRYGTFDVSLHRTMDYDMILRLGILAGDAGFARVARPLGCFRRHEAQKTQGIDDRVRAEHERIAANNGFCDRYRWTGKLRRVRYRARRAKWYLKRAGPRYLLDKIRRSIKGSRRAW